MEKRRDEKKRDVKKVPLVMQMEALECGAASLSMILAYYGKWLPLEVVRKDCGVSRDGSNAKNIALAAKKYGLDVKAYRMEPEALMKKKGFPCIIHWNMNHFVVLCGFKHSKAYINDPARGKVEVLMEEFETSFSGICLFMSKTDTFEENQKPNSAVTLIKSRLKGTQSAFLFVICISFLLTLIGVMRPAFSRFFLDYLLVSDSTEWMKYFFLGLAALTLIEISIQIIKSIYMLRIQGKMAVTANSVYMWHVLRLPMEFFSQRLVGDVIMRGTANEGITAALIEQLAPLVLDMGMIFFYLVVMLQYSILLTGIGLVSILVNIFIARYVTKKKINIMKVQMRDAGNLVSETYSGIEMMETLKSSGAENGYFERWSGYQASVNRQKTQFVRMNQIWSTIPQMVSSITNSIILLAGVYLMMQGEFSVGMILAFQGFLSSLEVPTSNLMNTRQNISQMQTDMERIDDVLKYPTDRDGVAADAETTYEKLNGNVELKNITFGYSRLGKPVIENFSMSLEQGKSVAFVGASGCGKSTLSKMISGLYLPWSGEILFDGKDRSQIPPEVFTGSVAVVDQKITLFEDTISENIRMWDHSIEDYEVILAARDAQLHEDIVQRDGGYEAMVLENGKNLSGGQRQRVEIARALAQDPTIVIMDEATSALDAETEQKVIHAIKRRGVSMIVIAHRLSTIRDCDEIIVLDHGKIAERGTHETLMEKSGVYAQLIRCE